MSDPFSIYNSKFDKKNKRVELAWEEGVHGKNEDPDDFYEGHSRPPHIGLFIVVLGLIFLGLGARLVKLQITHGAYYEKLSIGNHLRTESILAPRGIIVDSQNKPLLSNVPSFELVATPMDLPPTADLNNELSNLHAVLSVDPKATFDQVKVLAELTSSSHTAYQAINIIPNVSHDTALIFESHGKDFPGFSIADNPIREYVDPLIFSTLIGYTGKINSDELADHLNQNYLLDDYIGKSGLELSYEQYLRGTAGQKQVEVDAAGNIQTVLGQIEPTPGDNVTLNIDGDLQRELYTQILAKNGDKKAAAIAMNPNTGQILAMVSVPGYDNNLFAQGISQADYTELVNDPRQPLFDRAISGTYPPGSTIKLVMASAALQEKVVTPTQTIDDNGDLKVGSYNFRGWKAGGIGLLNIWGAIAESSDIYFYTVGGGQAALGIQGLGPERIAKYDYLFGMGQKLGIDLPGEVAGLIGSPEERIARFSDPNAQKWYLGDTYHESIGQGDMEVTPLQVAEWTSVVANGGTVYRPYIVDKVTDNNGKIILQNKPTAIRSNIIDPAILQIVRDGMRQTITSGTARSLNTLPIPVAGKTGTAQFDDADPSTTHAWFTAFAPYPNPKIVITVLIESGGEGTDAAAPVVKNTLAWWAANRNK